MEYNLCTRLLEPTLKRLKIDGTNGNCGFEYTKVLWIDRFEATLKNSAGEKDLEEEIKFLFNFWSQVSSEINHLGVILCEKSIACTPAT